MNSRSTVTAAAPRALRKRRERRRRWPPASRRPGPMRHSRSSKNGWRQWLLRRNLAIPTTRCTRSPGKPRPSAANCRRRWNRVAERRPARQARDQAVLPHRPGAGHPLRGRAAQPPHPHGGAGGPILDTLAQLKQACNHPGQLRDDSSPTARRSARMERLHQLLVEIIASSDRTLVFSQFAAMSVIIHVKLLPFYDSVIH